jgi:peptidoglycan/LPS O-acetylase OafA/YrhL
MDSRRTNAGLSAVAIAMVACAASGVLGYNMAAIHDQIATIALGIIIFLCFMLIGGLLGMRGGGL